MLVTEKQHTFQNLHKKICSSRYVNIYYNNNYYYYFPVYAELVALVNEYLSGNDLMLYIYMFVTVFNVGFLFFLMLI